jgi:hypothetical protein
MKNDNYSNESKLWKNMHKSLFVAFFPFRMFDMAATTNSFDPLTLQNQALAR